MVQICRGYLTNNVYIISRLSTQREHHFGVSSIINGFTVKEVIETHSDHSKNIANLKAEVVRSVIKNMEIITKYKERPSL